MTELDPKPRLSLQDEGEQVFALASHNRRRFPMPPRNRLALALAAALILPTTAEARARHHAAHCPAGAIYRVSLRTCQWHRRHAAAPRVITRIVYRTRTIYRPVTWDIAPTPLRSSVSWAGALPTWKASR